MRAVVVGAGAVGGRAARQLTGDASVVVVDRTPARARAVAEAVGASAEPWKPADGADVVVVAAPGTQTVAECLDNNIPVVSLADGLPDVEAMLAMETTSTLVIGGGMAPGLSDVLARHAAAGFTQVDEIHVAKAGTAGPACARQHHHALGGEAVDWRDGAWVRRAGGSGRELCWFPDPVGGQDCYRASLPDALLLQPVWPDAERITARMAATRRDRLTSALPMLRPPHAEGGLGAVRVEVRGVRNGQRDVTVLGAIDRPAVAAGAVAAVAALWAAQGKLAAGVGGLARLVSAPGEFLAELSMRGVKAATFEGAHARD